MKLSDAGRALLKRLEGLSLTAYPDGKGRNGEQLYSIGYGHNGVKRGDVITEAEADRLFDLDVARFERCVNDTIRSATQPQFDAMVSLCYNVGTAPDKGFPSSTVARRHNAGDFAGAADAFRMWNKSDGAVNPVLVKRRETELALYSRGAAAPAPAPALKPPSSAPVEVDSSGRINFASLPKVPTAAEVAPVQGAMLLGLGLLFFCPHCGAGADRLEVTTDGSREKKPAPDRPLLDTPRRG